MSCSQNGSELDFISTSASDNEQIILTSSNSMEAIQEFMDLFDSLSAPLLGPVFEDYARKLLVDAGIPVFSLDKHILWSYYRYPVDDTFQMDLFAEGYKNNIDRALSDRDLHHSTYVFGDLTNKDSMMIMGEITLNPKWMDEKMQQLVRNYDILQKFLNQEMFQNQVKLAILMTDGEKPDFDKFSQDSEEFLLAKQIFDAICLIHVPFFSKSTFKRIENKFAELEAQNSALRKENEELIEEMWKMQEKFDREEAARLNKITQIERRLEDKKKQIKLECEDEIKRIKRESDYEMKQMQRQLEDNLDFEIAKINQHKRTLERGIEKNRRQNKLKEETILQEMAYLNQMKQNGFTGVLKPKYINQP